MTNKIRKPNPWIIKLKQCAKEYQIKKLQSKQDYKRRMLTKGQQKFKSAVNSIEKKVLQKQKINKDFKMIRRIKGGRF